MIWLFIFISGGSISAIRAGMMGSCALTAAVLGRMANPRNAITFSAFVMVVLNPTVLINAAFQLSFLSFLGIYYLGPPIKNFFHWTDDGWLQWKEHAMLSLSTNMMILPIVVITFGGFSLTSFISNILIMIPWSVMIGLGLIIGLVGFVFPWLTFIIVQIENIVLAYEFFIIRIFANYTMPIPATFTSPIAIFFYYGLVVIFIYHYDQAQ